MSKFNFKYSKRLGISKFFLFITLFLLLSFSFLSKENRAFNFYETNLRKLGVEIVVFTIIRIFDYFYCPFFFIAFFYAPCLYCYLNEEDPSNDIESKNLTFFVNKVIYIINIGYIIASGVNFINDVEYGYSLFVFICASIYFLISSILYILISVNCKDICFPGICQWGYLKNMLIAPCCFFSPCKEEECRKKFTCQENDCNCCCICCIPPLGLCLCIWYILVYYLGLAFYALFWLIGKFFVFISCCDCWLKEDYDMDSFRFTRTSNTQLVVPESEEEKEVKKKIDKIVPKKEQKQMKKITNNIVKRLKKTIKETDKKLEES